MGSDDTPEQASLVKWMRGLRTAAPIRESAVRRTARGRVEAADWRGFYADVTDARVATAVVQEVPPETVRARLGSEAGQTVLARRRFMADGQVPLQLATTYFPTTVVEAIPVIGEQSTGKGGYLARFEESGRTLAHDYSYRAREATDLEAVVLELSADRAVLVELWTVTDAEAGEVLAVTEVIAVGTRTVFTIAG